MDQVQSLIGEYHKGKNSSIGVINWENNYRSLMYILIVSDLKNDNEIIKKYILQNIDD